MTQHNPSAPTLKEVLGYFAAEENHDKATLDRYLREFPQYRTELIDAAFELNSPESEDTSPLSAADLQRIERYQKQFIKVSAPKAADLLSSITASAQHQAMKLLDLPLIVISDILDRRVILGTIPAGFLKRFIAAIGLGEADFRRSYDETAIGDLACNYSSEVKPKAAAQVEFIAFLADSGVSHDRIQQIIKEG